MQPVVLTKRGNFVLDVIDALIEAVFTILAVFTALGILALLTVVVASYFHVGVR